MSSGGFFVSVGFDIAPRCRQFADTPRGGLQLARGSFTPSAVGEPRHYSAVGIFSDQILFISQKNAMLAL